MVKIADFGLSQFCRPGVLIKGDGCGTLTSAAPELLSAKGCHAGEKTGGERKEIYCVVKSDCRLLYVVTLLHETM